ncbi:hypothetical protein MARPO_0864s0001 [Marchantia polymorpha]|uniref:Uncharacterized protein n=1 Tax=Marchantia polymorpha TaxID=3197 RepID=A0A2R6VYE3_MARPO|nr:hypothetical protein MARPO_0864s0001 [Marchantia polymorpha]|eukprot:PTQ26609.1 hypothetical protein MARPO_0864s0001 [Marchantia polymorpha]
MWFIQSLSSSFTKTWVNNFHFMPTVHILPAPGYRQSTADAARCLPDADKPLSGGFLQERQLQPLRHIDGILHRKSLPPQFLENSNLTTSWCLWSQKGQSKLTHREERSFRVEHERHLQQEMRVSQLPQVFHCQRASVLSGLQSHGS